MNIKKIFAIMLVLTLAFSMVSCGKKDTSKIEKSEIGDLYASPGDFEDRTFEFTAKAFNIEKDEDGLYIQAFYDIENSDKNTIIYYEDSKLSVTDEDFIKVKGTVGKEFKGENLMGGEVVAPTVIASSLEVIAPIEAFPANKTIEVNETIKKGGFEATLKKVDFTDSEARIYLSIKNTAKEELSIYADQAVIVQDGKQYENNYNYNYDDMSSDIKAGASTEGVVAFDKIKEEDFIISFHGYNTNYDEVEFEYNVKVK